jgi:hypothetical protein
MLILFVPLAPGFRRAAKEKFGAHVNTPQWLLIATFFTVVTVHRCTRARIVSIL